MTEKCARHALPGQAPVDRYDAMGRVRLPGDYARWLRSRDNWLGEQSAVAVSGLTRDSSSAIRITSPVAGSTLILDPDLPEGGRRLPLRASSPLDAPQWTSTTLEIENEGSMWAAQLVPGRHEIRLRDGRTGAEARAVITVRSL
jgi:penicillin-binding protein 1C